MKRRILSMFLAVLLVAALALNVSAAYDWVEIGGEQYYCTLSCEKRSATGTTQTTSTETKVDVYIKLFVGNTVVMDGGVYDQSLVARVTATYASDIDSASASHMIARWTFHQSTERAPA